MRNSHHKLWQKRFMLMLCGILGWSFVIACGEEAATEKEKQDSNTSSSSSSNTSESNPTSPANLTAPATGKAVSTVCGTLGRSLKEGILIGEINQLCIIMQTADQASCRFSDGYGQCKNHDQAAVLCEGGVTPGEKWYLPSKTELQWMWEQRGEGSPVSTQGLCVADSGICQLDGSNPPRYPYFYWSSTATSGGKYEALGGGNFANGGSLANALYSVRCVKRVTP